MVSDEKGFYSEIISTLKEKKLSKAQLMKEKVILTKKYGMHNVPTDIQILMHAPEEIIEEMTPLLLSKPVRTQAGVAVVAIMTMPYSCPHGKCTFCPGGPGSHFGDVPQSYTGNEPATMRGMRNNYDAYLQVWNRLEQYVVLGQSIDKLEIIVMGGTFPAHPKAYKSEFMINIFRACNDFSSQFFDEKGIINVKRFRLFFELPGKVNEPGRVERIQKKVLELKNKEDKLSSNLADAQKENETSKARIVALCIETKPDWCKEKHLNEILEFGATRVEVGVQTLKEGVLSSTHRGHTLEDTKECTRLMKDALLKVTYHMMPGLPDTSREEDIGFFKELFENPDYKPDALKIYPCMVMPGTKLYDDYKKGLFSPITTQQAADIIAECERYVPEYCRIMRVQRDIPTKFSEAGVDRNNLRQMVDIKVKEKGIICRCIRCREAKLQPVKREDLVLKRFDYESSGGKEVFLSFEDPKKDILAGFLRLRLPNISWRPEFTEKTAGIREIHVYSRALKLGEKDKASMQHQGLGKELMKEAERIAKEEWKCDKILVISGIGVRQYYRKLGYSEDGVYLGKKI